LANSLSKQGRHPISGTELAQRVYDRETGDDSVSQLIMELIGKSGRKRVRELTTYRKDYGSLRKQLIRFGSPADIEGTGLLSLEKEGADTEQFLYLPALRRTRRIVSSQKDHRFVNTDFTFEDMERRPVEDSDHRIAGQERVDGTDCRVLESRPGKEAGSQYSMIKSWVAEKIDIPLLARYYDRKGKLIKEYHVVKLENIQGIWTETEVVMDDLIKKHKTIMRIRKIVYNTNLQDNIFTRQNLENW
jgi:Protein of unknown function (DUF1329).